jgi:hypothetical protein
MEVVAHVVGLVTEPHERDPEHGAGATSSTHAVHRDALTAFDVGNDIVGCARREDSFTIGISRRSAADEILQAKRRHAAWCGVVRRAFVREANDVSNAEVVERRPFGASGIRHADEEDRFARDPVEVVGNAQIAEKSRSGARWEQAHGVAG